MNKLAYGPYMLLDHMILNSGDMISFEVKLLNNKPWYNIYHESPFNKAAYYDGSDFERANELYLELTLAFKGIKKAEAVGRLKSNFLYKVQTLEKEKNRNINSDLYNSLKRDPLFLGINEF